MTIEHISVIIITRDAAETLAATLDSAAPFAHVVVWDNGSTDSTLEIAKRYANVSVHRGEFIGFGPSKNAACDCATTDWVFSLDADECIDASLASALSDWDTGNEDRVGEVLRENQFMGRTVRRGGWGDDRLVRLFHRTRHRFNNAAVHEKVATDANTQIVRLPGAIEHAAVRHIGQFLQKINHYTEIRRRTNTRSYPAPVIVLKAGFAFFRSYVLKLGALAGWRGLVIAWSNANGVFYKYMKVHADRRVERE